MNLTRFAVNHRTTSMAIVLVATLFGAMTFQTMPRREDPAIVIRAAVVVTRWPGASAGKVEDLVTDPIEAAVDEISEVKTISSTSGIGLSIVTVELLDSLPADAIDQTWDRLRTKVERATASLPQGCGLPDVNTDFGDVYDMCLTLYQRPPDGQTEIPAEHRYDHRKLELLAQRVKDELATLDAVGKVNLHGVQSEVIEIQVDGDDWAKIGLTADDLGNLLETRNIVAPGGVVDTGHARFPVRPTGEFESLDEISGVVVARRDEVLPIHLGDLPVTIRRTFVEPSRTRYRFADPALRAENAILLAVSMKDGQNVVAMGEEIRRRIEMLESTVLPHDVEIAIVNDLPRQVSGLVDDFVGNLWQAILIVLGVAFLMMGWRPALIMATAVPLSMIAAIAVVRQFDVELEQFSIASLIIALGMIVDNAIVVSDNCVRRLADGVSRRRAVVSGATDLAIPLVTSTLTTVAAFLPMLTIEGSSGEYMRSLPVVVSTTLLLSYAVAMTVTPVMCFWLLRAPSGEPRRTLVERLLGVVVLPLAALWRRLPFGRRSESKENATPRYDRLIHWCLGHKLITLGLALLAFLGSVQLLPLIGSQFFPLGDRDQFFVHVWLPEGASIDATETACRRVEDMILETSRTTIEGEDVERLANVTTFVGTGGPRLMLTSSPEQEFPNYAHLVVNTTHGSFSANWVTELREKVRAIPGARIDVQRFMLGPNVKNPVEVRLSGDDPDLLREKGEEITELLRATPGTLNPNTNWKNASYQIEVRIDHEAANLAGVSNLAVASTMSGLISGDRLTTYREGDHQVDVVLRLRRDQRASLTELTGLYVQGRSGKVPLGSIARVVAGWQPSVIVRRNRQRTISVGCQVEEGVLSNAVSASLVPDLDRIVASMPPGSRYEFGGEQEQSSEANAMLGGAFALSGLLIVLVLVAQYNSFLKPIVVLAAVPLALIGALLGLFVTGWPLGFMPSLGVISLAGVVINNAIVLIDFIEGGVRDGMPLREAVAAAGRSRMRPIVLTTLTTIGGMLPLALFAGPLWAGMAWAVIFGLALSTVLTLLVVPTLYALFAERLGMRVVPDSGAEE